MAFLAFRLASVAHQDAAGRGPLIPQASQRRRHQATVSTARGSGIEFLLSSAGVGRLGILRRASTPRMPVPGQVVADAVSRS